MTLDPICDMVSLWTVVVVPAVRPLTCDLRLNASALSHDDGITGMPRQSHEWVILDWDATETNGE